MSTIMSERDMRAARTTSGATWGRGAVPSARPAPRQWPAPSQQLPRAQERTLSDGAPLPTTAARERRGIISPALVFWLVVYTLLNVGDLLSTYFGLQAGLHEANPLMSGLLAQSGFSALIAYKLVVVVAVIAGAFTLYRMHPRAAFLTVHVCNALVFLAVFLNIAQMVIR